MKTISLYDADTYTRTGSGAVYKRINLADFKTAEELETHINQLKEEQKKKNDEYRETHPKAKTRLRRPTLMPEPLETPEFKNHLTITFDETGPQQSTFALLASSKAGKTTLIKYLFDKYYNTDEYISCLFSINSHIPLYDEFDIKISNINNRTLSVISTEHYINKNTRNHYKFFNVFDDCLNVREKKLMNDLILTYRNSNMSSLISLQYPKLLTPGMRGNVNHVLCGKFNNDETTEIVIKIWFKSFFANLGYLSLTSMINFYKKMTENHGFIYVNTLNGEIEFIKLDL
jgi:hypothetical protein